MPTKLSQAEVRKVAALARLQLSAEEEERFGQQLSDILGAVDALSGLDTANVPPTSHASLADGLLRADQARRTISVEEALANAPRSSSQSFAVPKVME